MLAKRAKCEVTQAPHSSGKQKPGKMALRESDKIEMGSSDYGWRRYNSMVSRRKINKNSKVKMTAGGKQ